MSKLTPAQERTLDKIKASASGGVYVSKYNEDFRQNVVRCLVDKGYIEIVETKFVRDYLNPSAQFSVVKQVKVKLIGT